MSDRTSSLGDRLRTVRRGLGLDQQDVARALGIHAAVISRHEHNKRSLNEETALRYAKHYGVSVEYLLEGPPGHQEAIPLFDAESGIPNTRGERLRELRRKRGYQKLAPTARMIGVNPVTMTHHEKGLREITRQAAELYGKFFGVPAGFILFGDDLPPENFADIVGTIKAGGRVTMDSSGEVRRVPTPSGLTAGVGKNGQEAQLIAFVVVGDELYPSYFHGDVVVVSQDDGPIEPLEIHGRECIIKTAAGHHLLGIIKSEGEDYYSIIGPHSAPQFHIRLMAAAPVLQIFRGLLRTNVPIPA